MKKLIAIIFIAIVNVHYATQLSIISGGTLSKYYTSKLYPELSFRYTPNLFAGIGIEQYLSESISISSAIILGSRGSNAMIAESEKIYLTGNYRNIILQIPVLLKWQTRIPKKMYFLLGPRVDFILSHRLKLISDETFQLIDQTNPINLGIEVGIGCPIKINSILLFSEIHYAKGLTSFFQSKNNSFGMTIDSIQIILGVSLQK